MVQRLKEYSLVFMIGSTVYTTLEMLWRSYTHWSMVLTGGACFVVIYLISRLHLPLWIRGLIGAGIITLIEFSVGVSVNLILGMEVWDYSGLPFNLLGQICLRYSAYWYILCIGAMPLCKRLSERCEMIFSADVHDTGVPSFWKDQRKSA